MSCSWCPATPIGSPTDVAILARQAPAVAVDRKGQVHPLVGAFPVAWVGPRQGHAMRGASVRSFAEPAARVSVETEEVINLNHPDDFAGGASGAAQPGMVPSRAGSTRGADYGGASAVAIPWNPGPAPAARVRAGSDGEAMSAEEHRAHAWGCSLRIGVITVSSTQTEAEDASGTLIATRFTAQGPSGGGARLG